MNKVLFSIVILVILSIMLVTFFANHSATGSQLLEIVLSNKHSMSPEQSLEEGKRIVNISSKISDIDVNRGASVDVPFVVSYQDSQHTDSKIIIVYDRIAGTVLPPSVVQSTTFDERERSREKGLDIAGEIHLSPMVRATPAAVTLKSGESAEIVLTISIPRTIPDEMINKSIDFSPLFKVVDANKGDDLSVFNSMTTVHVLGEK